MSNDPNLHRPLLQGWLTKQKSSSKILSSDTNRRWCAIESIQGSQNSVEVHQSDNDTDDQNIKGGGKPELVFCYYKSPSSKDKSGWIFLSDVTNVTEQIDGSNRNWIQVSHPKRTFKFRGLDQREHDLWVKTLCNICDANSEGKQQGIIRKGTGGTLLGVTTSTDLSENEAKPIGSRTFEPAKATYKKENVPYNASNSVISSSTIDRNHEAEIEFIRELTGQRPDDVKPKAESCYWHNEKVIVEENAQETDGGLSFTPSYHEIITKSGIEQHTLLSQSTSEVLHDYFVKDDETLRASKPDWLPGSSDDDGGEDARKNDHMLTVNVNHVSSTPNHHAKENNSRCDQSNELLETYHNRENVGVGSDQPTSSLITGSNKDHRLLQNINTNYADGTIHKRLERAILEPCITDEKENTSFTNNTNCDNIVDSRPIIATNKTAVVTMVQEISFDDEDSGASFATSQSQLEDNSDSDTTTQAQNSNVEENNNNFSYNSLLQLGDISFENDVLSLNHNFNEVVKKGNKIPVSVPQEQKQTYDEFHDSFLSPDEDFVRNDWDEEKSSSSTSSIKLRKKQPLSNAAENSFDTNCSFRPDVDFVDADWDS